MSQMIVQAMTIQPYKDGVPHSGIYNGNKQMIHAGTEETGVEITSLDNSYWQSHYIGAKSFQ
ncbi:NlpC/P60 family protein [Lentibacillus populi]|nr:NlpC/P60 family protein [Lentibacillus populi]